MIEMLRNKQWISYMISGGTFLTMALALQMYPVEHADMDKAGCILKFSKGLYDDPAGAEVLVSGNKKKPWTGWDSHETSWEPFHDRDVRLKPYWNLATLFLYIAAIGSFVHFVESAVGAAFGTSHLDGLLSLISSDESTKGKLSTLRDFLNIFFGLSAIVGVTLMILVMSGGVCQVGNPTVFDKLDDYDEGTKLSWNLAVIALGVEFVMMIVSLMFISGFDIDDERIGKGLRDLFEAFTSLFGVCFVLLLILGGLFSHEYRIKPHKVHAACEAFDDAADAAIQTTDPNGHRNSNFMFDFADKKTVVVDRLVETMAYSSVALIVFCVVEMIFGPTFRGAMRELTTSGSSLTGVGMIYTVLKVLAWLAVLGTGATVVCLWMTASTNGCAPIYTATHAYYVVPMIATGIGGVIGTGFINRGFIRAGSDTGAGKYRGVIDAVRELANPVFSSPF